MPRCGMCGANVPVGDGVCESCGFMYSNESETIISAPRWGRLSVDFSGLVPSGEWARRFRSLWEKSEKFSPLGLFRGQLAKYDISAAQFDLYCDEGTYLLLKADFAQNI